MGNIADSVFLKQLGNVRHHTTDTLIWRFHSIIFHHLCLYSRLTNLPKEVEVIFKITRDMKYEILMILKTNLMQMQLLQLTTFSVNFIFSYLYLKSTEKNSFYIKFTVILVIADHVFESFLKVKRKHNEKHHNLLGEAFEASVTWIKVCGPSLRIGLFSVHGMAALLLGTLFWAQRGIIPMQVVKTACKRE